MPNTTKALATTPALALWVALLPAIASAAPQFSVVASVAGGPQIGAIRGTTLYGTVPFTSPPFLFSLTTSGTYTLLHNFVTGSDGTEPNARMAMDRGGNMFGTTPTGGQNGAGTLWEYSAEGAFTVPHAFGANGDGDSPLQGPTMGPLSVLYGTTSMGTDTNNGSLFRMSHAGHYRPLHVFQSKGDGHCPFSGVAVGADGTVYGTTVGVDYGGHPNGSVWKFSTPGGLKTIYVFKDGHDGEYPDQAPTVDGAGNVYGTTHIQDGSNFAGAIWKISAAGKFSLLRDLNGGTDGFHPNSPLLLNRNGILYGTTYEGGPSNYGTLFSITPSGKFAVVHAFSNGGDGAYPTGNLVSNSDGAIFGGTSDGEVFRVVP
jgi:uncharacterized repeat protein (TIGR03803 family)